MFRRLGAENIVHVRIVHKAAAARIMASFSSGVYILLLVDKALTPSIPLKTCRNLAHYGVYWIVFLTWLNSGAILTLKRQVWNVRLQVLVTSQFFLAILSVCPHILPH